MEFFAFAALSRPVKGNVQHADGTTTTTAKGYYEECEENKTG